MGHFRGIVIPVGVFLLAGLRLWTLPLVTRIARGYTGKETNYLRSLGSTPNGAINHRNVFTQGIIVDKLATQIAISTTSNNIRFCKLTIVRFSATFTELMRLRIDHTLWSCKGEMRRHRQSLVLSYSRMSE